MKKIVFLLSVVFAVSVAHGQRWYIDTVAANDNYPYYMYADWPTTIYAGDTTRVSAMGNPVFNSRIEVAQRYIAREPIEIIGVACGIMIDMDTTYMQYHNLVVQGQYQQGLNYTMGYKHCSTPFSPLRAEYARLYRRNSDTTLLTLAEARYQPSLDTVDLRMAFIEVYNKPSTTYTTEYASRTLYMPIVEAYFEKPISVVDSFYVGSTECSADSSWPVCIPLITKPKDSYDDICHNMVAYIMGTDSTSWIFYNADYYVMVFPIIARNNSHDNPSSIGATTLADRYVTLSPNPATEQTTVVADCGLTQIDIYDNAGNAVGQMQCSGFTATIDTRGLTAGGYVVRVLTPLGVAVKKLIISR